MVAPTESYRNFSNAIQKQNDLILFQGMNATLRAAVRMSIFLGVKIYFIKEGYQGQFLHFC